MGEVPEPKATGWMRAVLGIVLAAFAWWTALPIVVVVASLFALGLTCGAAVSLEHSGALDDPESFRLAHWMAAGPLGLFFAVAYGRRLLKSGAKDEASLPLRWPALTACVILPLVALFVLWAAWDTKGVPSVAGAVILANLFFFSLGALLAMLYVAGVAFWLVYSWAAVSKFRTGLTTGLLFTPLAVLSGYAFLSSQPALAQPAAAAKASWIERAPAVAVVRRPAVSWFEVERTAFHELGQAIAPTHGPAPAVPASVPPATSQSAVLPAAEPFAPAHAPGADLPPAPVGLTDDNLVAACMTELVTPQPNGKSQVDQVKAYVQGNFGLWAGDAHDVVADALFSVCLAHARKRYDDLGRVLQKAGVRRAAKWRRRSQRSCPLEGEVPSCNRSADEMVRFESEDEILHGAICKEDEITQDIIYMHVIEGRRFGELAPLVHLTEDAARSKYNNARARLRKRLEATCGP